MNNSTADRPLPSGLLVGQPVPRLYDRVVECRALGIAESSVKRARRYYPDLPVGLKLGGKLLEPARSRYKEGRYRYGLPVAVS